MNTLAIFLTAIALYFLFTLLQLCYATQLTEHINRQWLKATAPNERGFIEPMQDDICVWADGTWCYRSELSGMSFMSDDIEILTVGSEAYDRFDQT